MRAWTKINYRIWESRMTLALPQLPQQLCFCSWGGSKGETQCQLKATYLSLVLHQTKPLLITEAFCMEQTGTLAGKLLAWLLCKKESLKKKKVGGEKKKREKFLSSASCRWAWERVLPIYQPQILFLLPVWIPLTAWAVPFPDSSGWRGGCWCASFTCLAPLPSSSAVMLNSLPSLCGKFCLCC